MRQTTDEPPRRKRLDLAKVLVLLPNILTLGNVYCGFWSIVVTATSPRDQLSVAAAAVLLGGVLDLFDGRLARLTHTQSRFGMELDSLADLVTFGVAPALLLYRGFLESAGMVGLTMAFLFVAAVVIRLARFNALASDESAGTAFVGLPSPVAAGTVCSLLLAMNLGEAPSPWAGAALIGVLAALMVSTVPYRSIKEVRWSPKTVLPLAAAVAVPIAASILVSWPSSLALMFLGMVTLGPAEMLFSGSFSTPAPNRLRNF